MNLPGIIICTALDDLILWMRHAQASLRVLDDAIDDQLLPLCQHPAHERHVPPLQRELLPQQPRCMPHDRFKHTRPAEKLVPRLRDQHVMARRQQSRLKRQRLHLPPVLVSGWHQSDHIRHRCHPLLAQQPRGIRGHAGNFSERKVEW